MVPVLEELSDSGIARFPMGGNEPVLDMDGNRIVDSKGRVSRVTTAGAAPSLGTYLLLTYLPPEHQEEGKPLQAKDQKAPMRKVVSQGRRVIASIDKLLEQ